MRRLGFYRVPALREWCSLRQELIAANQQTTERQQVLHCSSSSTGLHHGARHRRSSLLERRQERRQSSGFCKIYSFYDQIFDLQKQSFCGALRATPRAPVAAGPLHPPRHSRSCHRQMNRVVPQTACGAEYISPECKGQRPTSYLESGDRRSSYTWTWTTRGRRPD